MILTKLTSEECYDQVKLHGWSLFTLNQNSQMKPSSVKGRLMSVYKLGVIKRRQTSCNPETCHKLWLFCRTNDGKACWCQII